MPRFWDFTLPTQIQFGRGGLRRLGRFAADLGTSALLVGYGDRTGLEETYAKAEKLLEKAGMRYTSFFRIPPDPPAEIVERGAEFARQSGADVIVGLGGGSVMDAAKGIGVLARLGGRLPEHGAIGSTSKPVHETVPVIAVPTTAGTGSEVSDVAVFTHVKPDSAGGVPVKDALVGPAVRPKLALVDPDLAIGSPPALTAACGADALGHAVESYLSRRMSPFAAAFAREAARLIVESLPSAVGEPENPEHREPLALAATMAGAAFSAAGVTVAHALAQALGAVLHVPHGLSVAVATRHGLDFNQPACTFQYAELARSCRLEGEDDEALAKRFVAAVVDTLDRCSLPGSIPVPSDAPTGLLDQLVRSAYECARVPITQNPRRVSEEDLRQLFTRVLEPTR